MERWKGPGRGGGTMIAAGLLVAILTAPGSAVSQETAPSVADLDWIAGAWSVQSGNQTIEEHWVAASNALLGMGRTLSGERMVAFEYLRIETRPEGIFYVAQPSGRPPTSFRLTKLDGTTATFENEANEFPKRVIYSRKSENELTAWVDGGEGSSNALTFTYTRISR